MDVEVAADNDRTSMSDEHLEHRRQLVVERVWTVPGNMPVKFEVRSFNRVGIISTFCPKI